MRSTIHKLLLPFAILAAGMVTTAHAGVVFDGSPGTSAPPATLGPYTMTAFGDDTRSEFSSVTDGQTGPTGDVGFDQNMTLYTVGSGWLTWSHGYTGDVYHTGSGSGSEDVTMTLPANTAAFYFYAQPNTFGGFDIEAISDDGTSSGTITVDGNSGAQYYGFYGTNGSKITSITVTIAGTTNGFAVGEFGIAECPAPAINLGSAIELSPPNHSYHTINVSDFVTSIEGCASEDDVIIRGVTSDEDEDANGNGDGNTVDDIVIASDCRSVDLRAERNGNGDGRVYRIYVVLTDVNGDVATASFPVSVRKGSAAATEGSTVYFELGTCGGAPKQIADNAPAARGFYLMDNYPNPVSTSTTIGYSVPENGHVRLSVIDATGRLVATPVDDVQDAGEHTVVVNTSTLPSGTYYYMLQTNGVKITKSMVVTR